MAQFKKTCHALCTRCSWSLNYNLRRQHDAIEYLNFMVAALQPTFWSASWAPRWAIDSDAAEGEYEKGLLHHTTFSYWWQFWCTFVSHIRGITCSLAWCSGSSTWTGQHWPILRLLHQPNLRGMKSRKALCSIFALIQAPCQIKQAGRSTCTWLSTSFLFTCGSHRSLNLLLQVLKQQSPPMSGEPAKKLCQDILEKEWKARKKFLLDNFSEAVPILSHELDGWPPMASWSRLS